MHTRSISTSGWFPVRLPELHTFLEMEVKRFNRKNLHVLPPFSFDADQLEPDGFHLNQATGRLFLEHVSREVQLVLSEPSTVPIDVTSADPDTDETLVDVTNSDTDDVVTEPEGDSERLASILQIVRGNSRLLKTVEPLKDTLSGLVHRTDSLESQVRVRRQQDNLVFARIKEDTDYELNKSREDRVVISGLDPRIGGTHVEKKEHYKTVVSDLVSSACPNSEPPLSITDVFVNLRRDQPKPVIEVKFDSISSASQFRRAAAALAKAKDPKFAALFFSNSVTQATRVRIEIMRAIAKKLTTDSESAYVQGFISKPLMHYVVKDSMPSFCSGTGRSYTFVDSVMRFGDLLLAADLIPAYRRAGATFQGSMEQYFVLLREDFVLPSVQGANLLPLGSRSRIGPSLRGNVASRLGRGSYLAAVRRPPISGRKRLTDSSVETPSKKKHSSP